MKENVAKKRINWIDQLKGFGIVLVVYGHNFPASEDYIYSFHMPLFFLIAGLFHPSIVTKKTVIRRMKQILIPYFLWSFILFLFWLFIGRNFGDSANLDLSISDNLIGIFYAQGDNHYMNWGIPMWFLPCLFLTFAFFSLIQKIRQKALQIVSLIILIVIGFLIPKYLDFKLPWSLDIAFVSLFFYGIGSFLKESLLKEFKNNKDWFFLITLLLLHILGIYFTLQEVDMYRAIYGDEFLFLMNGLAGVLFWFYFFKKIRFFGFLSFFGKNTIPILAMQIRTLTVIKAFLFFAFGVSTFIFSETEKIGITILQLVCMFPILLLINKYIPILNGNGKKS